MGRMLQLGVTAASLVVLAGGTLYLLQFQGAIPDYRHFRGAAPAYRTIGPIIAGMHRLDSQSLIVFGILLLIATPVFRVIFGVIGFSLLRDRLYAAVSVIVLAILVLSFSWRR
jgi:uncharacterized membrane protein